MRVAESEVRLEVEDGGAEYPLTIDPLIALETKLTASDESAEDYFKGFGMSVAISGDTIVVGDSRGDSRAGEKTGAAYVFVRNSFGWWSQQAKLTASDAAVDDLFGETVSISNSRSSSNPTIVVSARGDDTAAGMGTGSVYAFVRSNGQWSQQLKLTASDAAETDLFGASVAISGDTIVAGASHKNSAAAQLAGAAYVKLLVDAVPY